MSAFLKLDNIQKSYNNLKVLDRVSFSVQGGQTLVLLGANGAGKTTLMRIIAGLEKPEGGKVVFNDKSMTEDEMRQTSTLVFQKTVMFSRSVYDNLAFGLRIRKIPEFDIKRRIEEALQTVGLTGFEKRKAKKTSGGEQQRISLARAMLLDPKILLLDEPTANLDPNSSRIIERTIDSRKNAEEIIIMATHNLGQAKRLADQIAYMHEGRIIETGPTQELFDNPKSEMTRRFLQGDLEI